MRIHFLFDTGKFICMENVLASNLEPGLSNPSDNNVREDNARGENDQEEARLCLRYLQVLRSLEFYAGKQDNEDGGTE